MSLNPLPQPRPDVLLTDDKGMLSRQGYDLLSEMASQINRLRKALEAAAIPIP